HPGTIRRTMLASHPAPRLVGGPTTEAGPAVVPQEQGGRLNVQRQAHDRACSTPEQPLAAPDPRIDPKFGAVEGDLKGRAKDLKEHPPAEEEEEASRAQAPPRPPGDDKASHAKAARAEMMARATPRGFGRAALIGVAKKAITEA